MIKFTPTTTAPTDAAAIEAPDFDQKVFVRDALRRLGTDGKPMTRAELARKIGVADKTIDNWLSGATAMPITSRKFIWFILFVFEKYTYIIP